MKRILLMLSLVVIAGPLGAQGAPPQAAANQPYTMEYYYKVQWGHQQEFLQLFLKNHFPLLQQNVQRGRMLIEPLVIDLVDYFAGSPSELTVPAARPIS